MSSSDLAWEPGKVWDQVMLRTTPQNNEYREQNDKSATY